MSAAELEDFQKMKTLVSAFYKFFVKTKNSLLDIKEIFKQVNTETYRFNNDFKNEIQCYADIESIQEQGLFQGRPGQAEQKKSQILDSVTNHTTVQANSVKEGIARVEEMLKSMKLASQISAPQKGRDSEENENSGDFVSPPRK